MNQTLPIDFELLRKHEEIPMKLAELSYANPDKALVLLRKWGEKKAPITSMHKELCDYLKEVN